MTTPACQARRRHHTAWRGKTPLRKPERVLCVEDNEDIRFMLTTVLARAVYEAASATRAGEALGLARTESFDLFILDTKLEEGDGLELCRELRSLRPDVPVIFYSAAAFDSDRQAAIAAGACGYVTKPGTEELIRAVRMALGGGEATEFVVE